MTKRPLLTTSALTPIIEDVFRRARKPKVSVTHDMAGNDYRLNIAFQRDGHIYGVIAGPFLSVKEALASTSEALEQLKVEAA